MGKVFSNGGCQAFGGEQGSKRWEHFLMDGFPLVSSILGISSKGLLTM
jgi:hypothetical protein